MYTQSHNLFIYSVLILVIGSCSNTSQDPWTTLEPLPLDPAIEAQIDEILPKLTLEQKVGQVIQADNSSVTPEDVSKISFASKMLSLKSDDTHTLLVCSV